MSGISEERLREIVAGSVPQVIHSEDGNEFLRESEAMARELLALRAEREGAGGGALREIIDEIVARTCGFIREDASVDIYEEISLGDLEGTVRGAVGEAFNRGVSAGRAGA
jgi:hypothetical protein